MDTLDTSHETAMDWGKPRSTRLKAVDHLCSVARRSSNEKNRDKAIEYLQNIASVIGGDEDVKERAQGCL